MLEYLMKEKVSRNIKAMFNRDAIKRLDNIRAISIENMYNLVADEKNPSKIVEKIKNYPNTYDTNRNTAKFIAYVALRKAVNFGEHLQTGEPKFIYNEGKRRIAPYTNDVIEPLGITQNAIEKRFNKYHKMVSKN